MRLTSQPLHNRVSLALEWILQVECVNNTIDHNFHGNNCCLWLAYTHNAQIVMWQFHRCICDRTTVYSVWSTSCSKAIAHTFLHWEWRDWSTRLCIYKSLSHRNAATLINGCGYKTTSDFKPNDKKPLVRPHLHYEHIILYCTILYYTVLYLLAAFLWLAIIYKHTSILVLLAAHNSSIRSWSTGYCNSRQRDE